MGVGVGILLWWKEGVKVHLVWSTFDFMMTIMKNKTVSIHLVCWDKPTWSYPSVERACSFQCIRLARPVLLV